MDIAAKMRQDWDRRAEEDARFWIATGHHDTEAQFRRSGRETADSLRAQLPQRSWRHAEVLEIGCGIGRVLRELAGDFGRLCGVDVSHSMIAQSRAWLRDVPSVETRTNSGVDLAEWPDGSFDLVYSYIAFQHMPRPVFAGYLAESHRVLRPQGTLLFQTWIGRSIDAPLADTVAIRVYSRTELRILLEATGFSTSARTLRAQAEGGVQNLWWLCERNPRPRGNLLQIEPDAWLRAPCSPVRSELDSRLRLARAQELMGSGQTKRAIPLLQQLVEEQRDQSVPALALAAAWLQIGARDQAAAELQRVLEHHPACEPAQAALLRLRSFSPPAAHS